MQEMLNTALKAAEKSGEIVARYFETSFERRYKDDESVVTAADEESEDIIIREIRKSFPEHAILAEESGSNKIDSEYLWIIDPIDGTRNFVNGIPIFSTSIALLKDGEPVVAVVSNPIIPTLFYAIKGEGSFWNGKRVHVSNQEADKGMVTYGLGRKESDRDLIHQVIFNQRKYVKSIRNLGSAALELGYLARGGTEGFLSIGNSKWDYAAGVLLALESGGMITDFDGNKWDFDNNYFVVSNGVAHDSLIELIQSAKQGLV